MDRDEHFIFVVARRISTVLSKPGKSSPYLAVPERACSRRTIGFLDGGIRRT